jgi:hypothetical protein
MSKPLVAAAVAACVGFLAVSTLWGQRPVASSWSSCGTALVDAVSITQKSARLKQALEALKREHEAKAEGFKQESQRGNQLAEQLKKLIPGSP